MADFTNRINLDNVQNFTTRSQGVRDTSVGDLFKGIGNTISQTADVLVQNKDKSVNAETASALDSLNVEFGLAGVDQDDTPGELNTQLQRAAKMSQAARKQGGSFSSLYYSRLQSLMRDLRQRYPNHGDKIDKAVTGLLGFNPRRAALQNYLAEESARSKSEEDSLKSMNDFYNSEGALGVVGPKSPESVSPQEFARDQHLVRIADAQEAKFKRLEAQGKMRQPQVEEAANLLLRKSMTVISEQGQLQQFLESGRPPENTQETEELVAEYNKLRVSLRSQLEGLSRFVGPGFSSEDLKKVITSKMEFVEDIGEALNTKDWSAAAWLATSNKIQEEESFRDLNEKLGGSAVTYKTMRDTFGEAQGTLFMDTLAKKRGFEQYGALVASTLMANPEGTQTFGSFSAGIRENNDMDGSEKRTAFREMSKTFVDQVLAAPNADVLGTAMKKLYNQTEIDRTLAAISGGDMEFLNFISSQRITDHIFKTDAAAGQEYTRTILSSFLNTDEYREFKTLEKRHSEDGQFLLHDGVMQFRSNAEINSGFRPGTTAQSQTVNRALRDLNPNFKNIDYALKKTGSSIEEVLEQDGLSFKKTGTGENQDVPEAADIENVDLTPEVLNKAEEAVATALDIGETGGTGDYDTLLGFSQKEGGTFAGFKPSEQTLDDLINFSAPTGQYGKMSKKLVGRVATPMGRYQIVGRTLRNLKDKMNLSGKEKFSPELQDEMFLFLLRDAGYEDFLNERITTKEFLNRADNIWEGLKTNKKSRAAFLEALRDFESGTEE